MAKLKKSSSEGNSWFSRGEEAAEQMREQMRSKFTPDFWLKDGESAKVIFLDDTSINIKFHTLKMGSRYKDYTCMGRGCPLCRIKPPSLRAVYRIIDTRVFRDKQGKVTSSLQEKYYKVGVRLQPSIAKLLFKKMLYKKVAEISRTGTGTATTYQIIPLGNIPEAKLKMLKEKGLLEPSLDFEKDFAPLPIEDLREIASVHGIDDDDRSSAPPEPTKNYLAEEDDDWGSDSAYSSAWDE